MCTCLLLTPWNCDLFSRHLKNKTVYFRQNEESIVVCFGYKHLIFTRICLYCQYTVCLWCQRRFVSLNWILNYKFFVFLPSLDYVLSFGVGYDNVCYIRPKWRGSSISWNHIFFTLQHPLNQALPEEKDEAENLIYWKGIRAGLMLVKWNKKKIHRVVWVNFLLPRAQPGLSW